MNKIHIRGWFFKIFKRKNKVPIVPIDPIVPIVPKAKVPEIRSIENHKILEHMRKKYGDPNLTFANILQSNKQRLNTLAEIKKKEKIENQRKKKQSQLHTYSMEELLDRFKNILIKNPKVSNLGFKKKTLQQTNI